MSKRLNRMDHTMFQESMVHKVIHNMKAWGFNPDTCQTDPKHGQRVIDKVQKGMASCQNPIELFNGIRAVMTCFALTSPDNNRANTFLSNLTENLFRTLGPRGFEPVYEEDPVKGEEAFKNFTVSQYSLCLALASWIDRGQHTYIVSDALSEKLQHTKLDNIPSEYIRLPTNKIYVRTPRNVIERFGPDILKNMEAMWAAEDVILEGIWVSELPQEDGTRILRFQLVGSAQIRTGRTIVVIPSAGDFILEDGKTLKEASEKEFDPARAAHMPLTHVDSAILKYVAAVAIYATSEDADVVLAKDSKVYQKWIDELKRIKKPGDRAVIEKQLSIARVGNTHYIGQSEVSVDRHTEKTASPDLGGTHASPATHWRVGHFRGQHYGEGNKQTKTIWVKPVLVNAGMTVTAPTTHVMV